VVINKYIYCNTMVSSNYLDLAVTSGDLDQSKVAGLDSRLQTARLGASFRGCLRADPPFIPILFKLAERHVVQSSGLTVTFFALRLKDLGNWAGVKGFVLILA